MISVTRAQEHHIAPVLDIERICFSVPWSENSFRYELESKEAYFAVAEEDGEVLGFGILHTFCDQAELFNIAVLPECRKRGIGDRLMASILDFASGAGIKIIFLEVRASNSPAQKLYEKHGFTSCGRRKNYYDKPVEDALLMSRSIGEQGEYKKC